VSGHDPGRGRDLLPGGAPPQLTEQRAGIVVFACGDPAHAEHDSVAIAACTSLSPELLERIDLKLVGPMRPEYLRDLAPATQVLIVDTLATSPGEVVEVTLLELSGREEPLAASSTPDPPLDEVVAMGQLLRETPLAGWFVGLGVPSVDVRHPPDPAAVASLRAVVTRTLATITGADPNVP